MNYMAYIESRSSSDTSTASADMDIVFLDVGEKESIAYVELHIAPDEGEIPETDWCFTQLVKLQQREVRKALMTDGKIIFALGRNEADLVNELTKASAARVAPHARVVSKGG